MAQAVPCGGSRCAIEYPEPIIPGGRIGEPRRTVYLGVPPAHRTAGPGLYWRVPAEREPTDPDLLFVALRIALDTPSGP